MVANLTDLGKYYEGNFSYKNFGSQTSQIKIGNGIFHSISINNGTTAAYKIYDSANSATANLIANSSSVSTTPTSVIYDAAYTSGLYVVTTGTSTDFTISYI